MTLYERARIPRAGEENSDRKNVRHVAGCGKLAAGSWLRVLPSKCQMSAFCGISGEKCTPQGVTLCVPGSFSGRLTSPKPQRGPDPRNRMSLAICCADDEKEDTKKRFPSSTCPDVSTTRRVPSKTGLKGNTTGESSMAFN